MCAITRTSSTTIAKVQAMSRAAFVTFFLLALTHVAEARAAGRETQIRAALICENVRPVDAPDPRSCNELKPQQRFQQIRDRTLARGHHTP